MIMQKYVIGFAFWRDQVLLLHKKKGPAYVVGRLNGVGGKIEEGEETIHAMVREFMEETGVETWPSAWEHVTTINGEDYELRVLVNFLPDYTDFFSISNPESSGETLEWLPIDNLRTANVVPNIRWLIPLCLDQSTSFITISEAK